MIKKGLERTSGSHLVSPSALRQDQLYQCLMSVLMETQQENYTIALLALQ